MQENIVQIAEAADQFLEMPVHTRLNRFLTLHEAGFNLIPSRADNPKKPKIKWKSLQAERQASQDVTRFYFENTNCNFFIITGNRPWDDLGVVVVDGDSQDGIAVIQARCPETPLWVETGREGGGRQFYYRHPGPDFRIPQILGVTIDGQVHDIDIKADGNYVVAPGSVHATGKVYEASVPITKDLIESLPVYDPSWLPHLQVKTALPEDDLDDELEDVAEHEEFVEEAWLPPVEDRVREARNYLKRVPGTQAGQQGKASKDAFALAMKLTWGFGLPLDDAVDVMSDWGEKDDQIDENGYHFPWSRKEIWHKVGSASRKRYKGEPGDKLTAFRKRMDERLVADAESACNDYYNRMLDVAGGDGASENVAEVLGDVEAIAEAVPRRAVTAEPTDSYKDDLLAAEVPVEATRTAKGAIHYLVACNCGCGLVGCFWRHLETFEAGYRCGSGRLSWADAKKLWTSGSKDARLTRRGFLIDDLDSIPSPCWQVKDHFSENSLVVMYGPSNVGKSFKGLDLGLSIATGRPYLGKHQVLRGAVCYVVGEGTGGIRKRIKAWRKKHGQEGNIANFVVIPFQFDLTCNGEADADEIITITTGLLGCPPSLIIIDTLNRHFGAGNENDTKDMTTFVKSCDRLRTLSGGTVLVVHHTGRDSERGERGNIALRNASDTVFSCEEYGDRAGMTIRCKKQKDSDFFEDYVVTRELVDLGEDVTSLVFNLEEEALVLKDVATTKLQRWKNEEEMVAHFADEIEGVEQALTRGKFTEKVQTRMRLANMEPIGETRIKKAINVLVAQGVLSETPENNANHRRVYKPKAAFFAHDPG